MIELGVDQHNHFNSKAALANLFPSEEEIGVTYEEPDGYAILPGFGEMGRCTNCAHFAVHRVGRGSVRGFLIQNNSSVTHDAVLVAGGHDFAVIDNRYIIDLWISLYTGEEMQVVYDLRDPVDQGKIQEIYGDPEKWWAWNGLRFVRTL